MKTIFGLRRDRGEDCIDINRRVLLLDGNGRGTSTHDLDLVDEKAVLGDDGFIAGRRDRQWQSRAEQLVRAVAAHDVSRIKTVNRRDGFAQLERLAVGIPFQLLGSGAEGIDCLRARPERRFVGRELVNPATPGACSLPGT